VLLKPIAQLRQGACATETPALLAVLEEEDGGKAPQPVMTRQLHVVALVHFHLGQAQLTLVFVHHPFQVGGQGMTGRAPVGPEVYQDRYLPGGGDDPCLELGTIDGETIRRGGVGIVGMKVVITVIMPGFLAMGKVMGLVLAMRGLEHELDLEKGGLLRKRLIGPVGAVPGVQGRDLGLE